MKKTLLSIALLASLPLIAQEPEACHETDMPNKKMVEEKMTKKSTDCPACTSTRTMKETSEKCTKKSEPTRCAKECASEPCEAAVVVAMAHKSMKENKTEMVEQEAQSNEA
jgi:hypothetical protein